MMKHALVTVGILLFALPSLAQEKKVDPIHPRDRGVEFHLGVGMDGCAGGDCEYMAPMLYTRLHGDFRVNRFFAFGVQVGFMFLGPNFAWADSRTALYDVMVAPEARAILPIKNLDLWVGFAAGYYHRHRLVDSADYEMENTANGMAIAWAIGAGYFLTDHFAIGADVWFNKGWNFKQCSKTGDGAEQCSTSDSMKDATSGITIAAGLTLTLHFPIKRDKKEAKP